MWKSGRLLPDFQARWKEWKTRFGFLSFPRFPRGVISTALSSRHPRSEATRVTAPYRAFCASIPPASRGGGRYAPSGPECYRPKSDLRSARATSVMHQAVQNAIGPSRISDLLVPLGHRQLAGQDCRTNLITVFTNLQEVAALALRQRRHRPVVHHEHVEAGQPGEQRAQTPIGAGQRQVAKQLAGPGVEGREAVPARLLGQGAGQETLAHPR